MQFSGTFREEGKQVVLEGIFCVPFTIKIWYSFLYALIILLGVWSVCDFIVRHNHEAAGSLVPVLGMAWWGFYVAKIKTENCSSDWDWLAASIRSALMAFDLPLESDS